MANCKNHISSSAIYKCSFCDAPLCFNCFNKYLITRSRKKIGFCSENCKNKYYQAIQAHRDKHRRTAYSFLRKALYSFFITILFFIIFNPIDLFIESDYNPLLKFTGILFVFIAAYGIKQLVNFNSVYFQGYDPELLENDSKKDKSQKSPKLNKNDEKIIKLVNNLNIRYLESYEINTLLEQFHTEPPIYVFAFGIHDKEILSSIAQFQKHKAPTNSQATSRMKIVVCNVDPNSAYIFFAPKIHPYIFYSFMSFMDPSNSAGFITIRDKTYLLKIDEDTEYIYGTNDKEESIEISIVDGSITAIDEIKHPYFNAAPDFSQFKNVLTVEVEIENVREFGNPEFIIDT